MNNYIIKGAGTIEAIYTAILYYHENGEYKLMEETRETKEQAIAWLENKAEFCKNNGVYVISAHIETKTIERIF
jgi:uncharacterized protein YbjQ (UPF0145 family)